MYQDKNILVYVGYPSEVVASPPSWVDSILKTEVQDPESPFRFYLSGGAVTPNLYPLLKSRAASTHGAQKLAMKLVLGYTSRLIDPLLSADIDKWILLAKENHLSTEYRILLDLWVLSRADVYLVDCDLLGRGRGGMETVYAHNTLRTVGVTDSPILDLWFQYHLDTLVKSQMCRSHLESLKDSILASRGASSNQEALETPEQ